MNRAMLRAVERILNQSYEGYKFQLGSHSLMVNDNLVYFTDVDIHLFDDRSDVEDASYITFIDNGTRLTVPFKCKDIQNKYLKHGEALMDSLKHDVTLLGITLDSKVLFNDHQAFINLPESILCIDAGGASLSITLTNTKYDLKMVDLHNIVGLVINNSTNAILAVTKEGFKLEVELKYVK